jgi:glycine hydroxymethyltransferase
LAITFAELLHFGKAYGAAVVRNARALAHALDEQGFRVIGKHRGYTQSHLVLFDVPHGDRIAAKRRLEAAGLFVSAIDLPAGSPLAGVRAGTASVTRRGMGEAEMRTIATLIRRILLDGEEVSAVERDVAELASAFSKVHFSFA